MSSGNRPTIRALAVAGALLAAALATAGGVQAATLKTLYVFCEKANCTDGAQPIGGLTMDGSGNLFGTTFGGGRSGGGTVFELVKAADKNKWKYKLLHSFCVKPSCEDGAQPTAPLILDGVGNLYGTGSSGGTAGDGIVFELSPDLERNRWDLRILYSFKYDSTDGLQPTAGGLAYAGETSGAVYDGVSPLYGMTEHGGAANNGVVFELRPVTGKNKWREKILYTFCSQANCTDGVEPHGGLTMDQSGSLYGTTVAGGTGNDNKGVLFELIPNGTSWSESVLHNFCSSANCSDGASPFDTPLLGAEGELYGTTQLGGANGLGVVFKFLPGGSPGYAVLYNFCSQSGCTDGMYPIGGLVSDSAGTLYGTTRMGGGSGGVVFELNATFQVLHTFNGSDGQNPVDSLILDESGKLFGTTSAGGDPYEEGTAFELVP
jgi:uncharacterized repeat protein (TIGR03803 family)